MAQLGGLGEFLFRLLKAKVGLSACPLRPQGVCDIDRLPFSRNTRFCISKKATIFLVFEEYAFFTKDAKSLEDFPKSAQGLFQRCAGSRMPCEIMRFQETGNLNYSTILVKNRSANVKVARFD